jgi:hypothetical protein
MMTLSVLYDFFCEAIGTAATPGLLCQPRLIMKIIVETRMKFRLAGETEVLGENLPQRHFCPSHVIRNLSEGLSLPLILQNVQTSK